MPAFRHVTALFFACALTALASCGGGGFNTAPDNSAPLGQWPGHGWDGGARQGAFVAVAVDGTERELDPLTSRLRLEHTSDASGELVRIFGLDIDGASVYLHLKYDDQRLHPAETQRGAELSENVLFLGVTSQPGVVVLGLTTIGGTPMPTGEQELAQVRFAPGAVSPTRATSTVLASAPDDLRFQGNTLKWTYNGTGDYDQNGETNISDLTPVGVHLDHSCTDGQHDGTDSVVDGDGNGLITLAELTYIGANYLRRITLYQVKSGPTDSGPFAQVTDGSINTIAGEIPAGGGFREYSFSFTPQANAFYVVQGYDQSEPGSFSNMVQYGTVSFAPPQNLSAADDGSKITLTWTPPATGTPTGYNAFVADNAAMTGAIKMNATPVAGLTFDCSPIAVPVGDPHFFAVSAVYSGGESGYSNIFSYGGGGGVPTNLSATKESAKIRLNWNPVAGADSYNCYVGELSDLSGATVLHLPGQVPTNTFLCPGIVDAAIEHYFGVKAVTDSVESAYSNIAHYVPSGGGDTMAPQFQNGIGIRSVEPDNAKAKVYWYPAIDPAPGTPPVQYLIYYSEEGTGIDWQNPTDVIDSPATSATVTGLTNGQRYEFAVRAQDGVPNVTSNTNTLFATPAPIPGEGAIGSIMASDVASVRMPSEEAPRLVSVSHGSDLTYTYWNGDDWVSQDLNILIVNPARKYHPQMLAVGTDIHILFGTANGVYEVFTNSSAVPPTWTVKTVATGLTKINGTGFSYDPVNNYLACVYAAEIAGEETLFYCDRNPAGEWGVPEVVMDTTGSDKIWQCDFTIAGATGAQWAVACRGPQVSQDNGTSPEFAYATRAGRLGTWTVADSGFKSSTEITVEIDPLINQPVVVNPQAEWYNVPLASDCPATSACVYTWNGSFWDDNNSPIDEGNVNSDESIFVISTNDMGRDPQCVFTASGKAVATWTNVTIDVDYSSGEAEFTLQGSWRLSARPALAWDKPSALIRNGIYSSNSVTAGESYQHVLTCYVAASDFGDSDYVTAKYATRNHYPEGELYYFKSAWP